MSRSRKAVRRVVLALTVCTASLALALSFVPVAGTVHKLAFLFCLAATLAGLLTLSWGSKPLRFGLLALLLAVSIVVLMPGEGIGAREVGPLYLQRLARFESTQYVWGGESRAGIDCSGLPRRALRGALLQYGVTHLNGPALRAYLEQWWFDASAKSLGEGYRGYTRPVGVTGTVREMEYGPLAPGDLAVTTSGLHVMVYMGNGEWIQADPNAGRVVTLDGREGGSAWFDEPVSVHRWQVLDRE